MRAVRRRLLPFLAVSLTALGALSLPASASSSPWKKGGQPTCSVTITSASSSSTTCTGSLSGTGSRTQSWLANLDVDGFATYLCQDSTGATVAGQNQVGETAGTSTPFQTSNRSTSFTTDPTALAAPSTVSASQAGCASGTTAVAPTLTTFRVTLSIALATGDGTIATCTATDRSGLSGTVALVC